MQSQVEGLNEHALEILRLLADGLTDREIAEKVIMTVNTVKWYNRQIYSVLGVSSRTQAIAHAHELHLLDTEEALVQPTQWVKHSLPVQPTHFIGRKRAINDVKRLLNHTRLLTLIGSPGTGKTRLAVQVASEIAAEFQDGVCYVPLAPISDPSFLIQAIAQALGLEDLGKPFDLAMLELTLGNKQMLLLLDNFEHMMAGAALISELLAHAPNIKVMITSREVLHLYGEQEYFVPPMSLPDPETSGDFNQFESVALFIQQAQTVIADFQITDANALDIAKICIRLDGLPLAIELVAARIKLFSPRELLARMDSVLETFASNRRDISSRHQTLKRTLDWSYALLDEAEKTLFARLGVFGSGWTLEAAEYICNANHEIDVVEGLSSLVDKSLVRQETTPENTTRFTLLRIIHEYAAQQLKESGEAATLQQRHADYYVDFAERVSISLHHRDFREWLNLLECEHNNFRAVLRWSLTENPKSGLELIHVLGTCWRIRGHLSEGYQWAQSLFEKSQDAPPVDLSKALSTTSNLLACILGNHEEAQHMALKGLVLAREVADPYACGLALFALGNAVMAFDSDQARTHLHEAIQLFRQIDDQWNLARALNSLGEVVRVQGDNAQAMALYEEALALFREVGNVWGENTVLPNLAHIALRQENFEQSQTLFAEVLRISVEFDDEYGIANAFIGIAAVLVGLGQPEPATRLLGAAEAMQQRLEAHIQPGDLPDYERHLAVIQSQLDEDTFTHLWQEGRDLSLTQALNLAEYSQLESATN